MALVRHGLASRSRETTVRLLRALKFAAAYAGWALLFRLVVLSFITYFLVSSGSSHRLAIPPRFDEIAETFASNEVSMMGICALLFVFFLRSLYPLSSTTTEEIFTPRRFEQRFIPGFLHGSLVALGIGRLLGVPTPRNFDSPFESRSLTEYWTRWHMSLASFVRRQIYFPLQLFFLRRSAGRHAHIINVVSLTVAFVFVGLWHRVTVPFLVWGLLYVAILSAEKITRDKFVVPLLARYPRLAPLTAVVGPIYVTVVVVAVLHLTVISQLLGG